MSWARIVKKAIRSSKNAKDSAKNAVKSKIKSAKDAMKEKAFSKVKDKSDLTIDTYRGAPYSELDTTNALVPVGDNAWTTQKPLSEVGMDEIIAQLALENPGKAAAITGGAGLLGTAAMLEGNESQEPSPEIEQITEILRKQGLSDDQITDYLNQMMQTREE